jgi:hypothetical protein
VVPGDRWLCDESSPDAGPGGSSFVPGCFNLTSRRRADSSFGSRQSVLLRQLPEAGAAVQNESVDESQGELLGQRADGELLRHIQDRAGSSSDISQPTGSCRRCSAGPRGVLQPAETTCQLG